MGGIFRIGADADLVGMSLDTLPTKRALTARVELDEPHQFTSVDPHAALLPAYVTGTLHGIKAGAALAVAVNGRIRAVAPAIELEGEVRVAAMVSPSAFRRGTNDVRVLEVRHSVPLPSLVLLHRRRYESFKIVQAASGETILGSSGTKVPISRGGPRGFIEQLTIRDGTLTVEGWAATSGRPAERLLLFFDGQYLGAARPTLARPDVARVLGPGAKAAGYEITAKVDDVATAKLSKVRLFAVARARASELPRLR
jgi:hypothetical protein